MPRTDVPTETEVNPGSTATSNKISAPKVGDTMTLVMAQFGGVARVKDETDAPRLAEDGDLVLTVTVNAVKKAKMVIDDVEQPT